MPREIDRRSCPRRTLGVPRNGGGVDTARRGTRDGGAARPRDGALEACGGALPAILTGLGGGRLSIEAIALGHVILARSAESLDRLREHERVHVRQWELVGARVPDRLRRVVVVGLAAWPRCLPGERLRAGGVEGCAIANDARAARHLVTTIFCAAVLPAMRSCAK